MTEQVQEIIEKIERLVKTHYDVWFGVWMFPKENEYRLNIHLYGQFPKLIIANLTKEQVVEILDYFARKYGLWENEILNFMLAKVLGTIHFKVYNRKWYLWIKKWFDLLWIEALEYFRFSFPIKRVRNWADNLFYRIQERIKVDG